VKDPTPRLMRGSMGFARLRAIFPPKLLRDNRHRPGGTEGSLHFDRLILLGRFRKKSSSCVANDNGSITHRSLLTQCVPRLHVLEHNGSPLLEQGVKLSRY
jgi:hypothetical protein